MNREKVLRALITCVLLWCSYFGLAQGTSSQGKEFWTAYMSHIEDNGESQMALYVTADDVTDVTLEVADNSFAPITKHVTPNQVTIINVPKIVFLKNNGQFIKKGLHITAGKKVAVFAHIYAKSVSGATLLLPVSVLGKSYYSINYEQASNANDNAFSTFMVIATEDNTTVQIKPSQDLTDGRAAGQTFTLNLNKGDVYQGFSFKDLTNTQIRSISSVNGECKKIAVFSGSTKIGIGCQDNIPNHFTSDNLFQQVYPTTSWGREYVTVPLKNRNYDILRVVISDPNTQLFINGNLIPKTSYQTPFYYQFETASPNHITADKPIQVVQYAVSQGKTLNSCVFDDNDVGDPEMIYLNPLEQTLDHVTLYSTRSFNITSNYVNVVIKTGMESSFKVDGSPYTNFLVIPNDPFYSFAQIPLPAGSHTLNAAEGFSAIAYGFGANESYGYSAGTNLKNLNENLVFTSLTNGNTQTDGCKNEEYRLRLSLPFQPTKIIWDFKGIMPNVTDVNPSFIGTATGSNGQTLYQYQYNTPVSFTVGDHSITAVATNPLADECGSDTEVDFDFNIADQPKPFFTIGDKLCSESEVVITQPYTVDLNRIKVWWDWKNHPEAFEVFEKNQLPADATYRHTYNTTGNFTIRTEAFTGPSALCSDAYEKDIVIKISPVVSFNEVNPMCYDNGPVQLVANNNGYVGNGVFSGTGVNANGVFDPAVSGPGTFTITYTFTANNTCDASFSRDITVYPLPVVDAGKYIQLLEGGGVVLPAKASGDNLTYHWEPVTWLDNPNVLHPVSSAADNITYKLTVTTAEGCTAYDEIFVKVLKKPVIVNAFTPNGDGINDTWVIKFLDTYPGNTVDVFNRQGEKVYSSVGYAIPWDGRQMNGAMLPTGTYFYIINPKNGRKAISGTVTIIK